MPNEVKTTFTGEDRDLLAKTERINRKIEEMGRLAESAGQKIDRKFAGSLQNLSEGNIDKVLQGMRGAAAEGQKTVQVLDRLKSGAAEGGKQVGALASIFTATTENGRKMRAMLYDIANQAGLPGVARGLGVFGGGPGALVGGFAFLEIARSANAASEEILKANQEALKFEETMANFGVRGGAKQVQSEVSKLIEVRNAMSDVAALGGSVQDQIAELNKAGLRKPEEKQGLFSTILRIGATIGGGDFLPPPQGPLGVQNQQELDQLIRAGQERFLKLERLADQAGGESIFSKAREGLGLEVPKRIKEIDEMNQKLTELENKFKRGGVSVETFNKQFKLLQDAGKNLPETIASERLEALERAVKSNPQEFIDEANKRGISAEDLHAEKVRAIGKEAQAAKTQLQEFNRAGDEFGRKADQREKLKAGSDIALEQLSRGLNKNDPFALVFDQGKLRIDQFKKQYSDLGEEVIKKAEEINNRLTRLDFFSASLNSLGRIVQMQERVRQLSEGHEFEDAERKRRVEFGERQASLATELRELQRGARFDEVEKASEAVRRLVQTPGLVGKELSEAIEKATHGLSIEQLRAGGLLYTRQDALSDIASSERTAEAFRKAPPEVREANAFIEKAQADFNAGVERARRDTEFAKTFDKARSQELLDREIIAFTSRISPDKLTPDLREKERDATQRQIEREVQNRAQAQAMLNKFGESVTQFNGSVEGMKSQIIDFIKGLAAGINIEVNVKDSPFGSTRSGITSREPNPFTGSEPSPFNND